MDIEDDGRTRSGQLWRQSFSSKTKRFAEDGSPHRSSKMHRKTGKPTAEELNNSSQSKLIPLSEFLKDEESFLSRQSVSCRLQYSPQRRANEQRLFVTPPKRSRNDTHHELTKKEYRECKQESSQEVASRFDSDYEVLGTLGSGCFGTVKRCRNKIDNAVYAVKIMDCYDRKNLNEVKAMAQLSSRECSHIVRYHHSWIEGRLLYMAMEWCQSSLRPLLDQRKRQHKPFYEADLKKILEDTLKALSEMHRYDVAHLDVKPENILRTFTGHYKLGDLGLCRPIKLFVGEEISEGDGKYMAREILNNYSERVPDLTRADLFSLGMTMFELMSLENLPYNGSQWHTLRNGAVHSQLDALSNLYSQDFIKIVKNLTEANPSTRHATTRLLKRRYFASPSRLRKNSRQPPRHFSI